MASIDLSEFAKTQLIQSDEAEDAGDWALASYLRLRALGWHSGCVDGVRVQVWNEHMQIFGPDYRIGRYKHRWVWRQFGGISFAVPDRWEGDPVPDNVRQAILTAAEAVVRGDLSALNM